MTDSTKVVIISCTNRKYWYDGMIGRKLHIYGTIDNPTVMGNSYVCVENSAAINTKDVILVRD